MSISIVGSVLGATLDAEFRMVNTAMWTEQWIFFGYSMVVFIRRGYPALKWVTRRPLLYSFAYDTEWYKVFSGTLLAS